MSGVYRLVFGQRSCEANCSFTTCSSGDHTSTQYLLSLKFASVRLCKPVNGGCGVVSMVWLRGVKLMNHQVMQQMGRAVMSQLS
jgi:hypothetical protein